jgi:hypothetical protein
MSFAKPKLDLTPPWEFAPIGKNKPKKKTKKAAKKKKASKDVNWEAYKKEVESLTELNKNLVEGIDRRSYSGFHIDHKISKRFGYDNNIPAQDLAHPSNLHMMWWEDNFLKGTDNIVDEHNAWILENRLEN